MILTIILAAVAIFGVLIISGFGKNTLLKNPQGVSDKFLEVTMRQTGTILDNAIVGSPEWQGAGRKHEAAHREWRRRQGLPELVVEARAAQPALPELEMPDIFKGRWIESGRASDDWHTLSDDHLNLGSGDERITSITIQESGTIIVVSKAWENSDGDRFIRELVVSPETDELTDLRQPSRNWRRA